MSKKNIASGAVLAAIVIGLAGLLYGAIVNGWSDYTLVSSITSPASGYGRCAYVGSGLTGIWECKRSDGSLSLGPSGPSGAAGATGATGPSGPSGAAGAAGAAGSGCGSAGVNAQTSGYTLVSGDSGKLVTMNGTSLTATLYGSPSSGYNSCIENLNSTALTVATNSLQYNGATTSISVPQYWTIHFASNGTNYFGTVPDIAGSNVTITNATTGHTIAATGGGAGTDLGALIHQTTGQNTTTGSNTNLTIGTVVRDDGGFTGTANKLTIPAGKTGWYVVTAGVQWDTNTTGLRGLNILVNGALPLGGATLPRSQVAAGGSNALINSVTYYLTAGDLLSLSAFQNSGSNSTQASGVFLGCVYIN